MNIASRWLFFGLLVFMTCSAPNVHGQSESFQQYSVTEGLPQSQVYALIQDHSGFLWMGTQGGGVARFDGLQFKTFTTQDGLPSNYVFSIYQDDEKLLWIGTKAGLCTYDGFSVELIELDTANSLGVSAIIHDGNQLIVGTTRGVFTIREGQVTKLANYNNAVNALYVDANSGLWICDNDGILLTKTNKRFNISNGLPDNHVMDVVKMDHARTYISLYGGGIVEQKGEVFQSPPLKQGAFPAVVYKLYAINQLLYFTTLRNGVGIYNPADSTLSYLSEQDGLSNNHTRVLLKDSWANLWVGTSGGGLNKYGGVQFKHYNSLNNLKGKLVYAIESDTAGQLWLGAGTNGLVRKSGELFNVVTEVPTNSKFKALKRDSKGRMWAGSEGAGVWVFENDTAVHLSTQNGLSGNWIRSFEEDQQGNFYIGTAGGGITKLVMNDSLSVVEWPKLVLNESHGLPNLRINNLVVDRQNRLWCSVANAGIICLENDRVVHHFTKNDGLTNNTVRALAIDSFDNLWIGTASGGLCTMALGEDRLAIRQMEHKLVSDNVYLLQFNEDNNLWVGTAAGIELVTLNEARNIVFSKSYGRKDGFTSVEVCQNSSYVDSVGNIWFGTIDGLTKYQNIVTEESTVPPKASIQTISLFYQPVTTNDINGLESWNQTSIPLELAYDQNHIDFEFNSVDLTSNKVPQFAWKLEGLDETWSPWTERSNASYTSLPPGKFTFQVKSKNKLGMESEIQSIPFVITTPFWQKRIFWVGCGALLVILIGLAIFRRVLSLKKKHAAEKQQLELERRSLELEQQALRLQMNPHFIFNTLNTIQAKIVANNHKDARYYLSKFSSLMRMMLDYARQGATTLDEEVKLLDNYLLLEQKIRDNRFEYSIEVDDELESEWLAMPPMIVQPFIENAIIHGFKGDKKDGKLIIRFYAKAKDLIAEIEDNGIGRAAAKNQHFREQHKSHGLEVTAERLALLQGSKAHFEIVDLEDQNGIAKGTKVVINLGRISAQG